MLIKQSDYHRIYKVINSLLIDENADPATASMHFTRSGPSFSNVTSRSRQKQGRPPHQRLL